MNSRVIIEVDARDDIRHVMGYFDRVHILTLLDWRDRIFEAMNDLSLMPQRFAFAEEADLLKQPLRIRPFGQ